MIINELSNGPEGSKEYIEMLVVPDGPVIPCTPPTCLDLRGWIIDDNNGYHGTGGVAQGAARFTNHSLWSCVPVGTLIVIYNAQDPNPALPPVDVTLGDGNCSLIVPSSDFAYFEYTNTTPAPVPCDYPGGWGSDPTPTWQSNLAFANTGDCARIADAAGCLVFSVCYGNVSQNASVHFPGNGGDRVWSFTSGDPLNAAAWIRGCAGDIAACGADDQTPGAANSAANAAWMSVFNNGCVPPQQQDPLVASASATTACACNGTAAAQATGSVAPYTFAWHAADWSPVGQSTSQALGLCSGVYHVIVTSFADCVDTVTVDIVEDVPVDAGEDAGVVLCATDAPVDLFDVLLGSPQAGGSWSPELPGSSVFDPASDPAGAYTYTVAGQGACPPDQAVVQVTVVAMPVISPQVVPVSCSGFSDGSILVEVAPPAAYVITWSGGLPDGPSQDALAAGAWIVEVTGPEGCSTSTTVTVGEPDAPSLATTTTPARCSANGTCCVAVEGMTAPYTVQWDDADSQQGDCARGLIAGPYTATITDTRGCIAHATVTVEEQDGNFSVTHAVQDVRCAGEATGSIALMMDPPGVYVIAWTGPEGYEAVGERIDELEVGDYTYAVQDMNGCAVSSIVEVNEPGALSFVAAGVATTCVGVCDGRIEPVAGGGTAPWRSILQGDTLPLGTINGRCAGTYMITLIDAAGCRLSSEVVIGEGTALVMPTIAPAGPFCEYDDAVQLIADPPGGSWSGPGITDATVGLFDPSMAGAGAHTVSYALTSACGGNATAEIFVDLSPTARTILPVDPGMPVISSSLNADGLQWWVNGLDMGHEERIMLPEEGEAVPALICLTAYSNTGCSDMLCTLFSVPTPLLVHVPNAFTPNGDGINDEFLVAVSGPLWRSFTISVYDRWGWTVFTAFDPSVGWDGSSGGTEVPMGVYPWRVTLSTAMEERVLQGHVIVVR